MQNGQNLNLLAFDAVNGQIVFVQNQFFGPEDAASSAQLIRSQNLQFVSQLRHKSLCASRVVLGDEACYLIEPIQRPMGPAQIKHRIDPRQS